MIAARRRGLGHRARRGLLVVVVELAAAFDAGGAGEVAVDAGDALDLALGREALVEALDAELLGQVGRASCRERVSLNV